MKNLTYPTSFLKILTIMYFLLKEAALMDSYEHPQENKMGIMPISKLLISMSLPVMISMLIQALYNIVDSMFVAQISENALTAVSLAFPVQNLMIAVAAGTGVGINALLSRSLGEKNLKEANKAANNGVFLALSSAGVFTIFGIFFSRIFFESQTQIKEIIDYGSTYISICTIFSFGIFGQITFERLLQSTGKTFYTMITQSIGAIINIILDPILIFGLFGFPKLGVTGAAIATVIGQIIGMFLTLYYNVKKNSEIQLKFKNFKPNKLTIKKIYSVGIPSIIMQSISSVMVFGLNNILLIFSSTAAAVLGIYFKLQSFIFMPIFGITIGMIPIVAYNYGAGNKERLTKTIKLSAIYAVSIMLIGFSIFQIFPKQLLSMFNASSELINIGVIALRTISFSFIFAGYCIVLNSAFQALGNGMLSLINSIIRQLVIILPAAFLFAKYLGLNAVWFAFPLAEISSVILSTIFLKHIYSKKIKHIISPDNFEM